MFGKPISKYLEDKYIFRLPQYAKRSGKKLQ